MSACDDVPGCEPVPIRGLPMNLFSRASVPFSVSVACLAFSTLSSAAELPTYTYFRRVPATARSCADEALQLKQRFEAATGVPVSEATCRDVVELSADGKSYPVYSLALT